MSDKTTQSFENHTKNVPLFHFVVAPILLVNLLWAFYRLVTQSSVSNLMSALLAVGLMLLFFFARTFALGVQDRVIRLEERLRLDRILPDDLSPSINDYTTNQLVALRFASDDELPDLSRKILDEGISDRKTIKKMIINWRADHQRI